MLVEIQAGAKIDIASPDDVRREVRGQLGAWQTELRRGVKFRRAGGQATLAGGVWSLDDSTRTGSVGPAAGFLWSVTNIAVQGGGYVLGTDTFNVYFNQVSGLSVVATGITRQIPFDIGQVVLNGPEALAISGVGTGVAGTDVNVTILVAEVPDHLAQLFL